MTAMHLLLLLVVVLLLAPAAANESPEGDRGWTCPDACTCFQAAQGHAHARSAHPGSCGLETVCTDMVRAHTTYPTGYDPRADCVTVSMPMLADLTLDGKGRALAAIPAGASTLYDTMV